MRKIIGFIFLLSITRLGAQGDVVLNLPEFDQRYIHFGFSIGLNQGDYFIRQDHLRVPTDSILGIEVRRDPGFNVNAIVDYHLGQYFGLRFTPGLSLSSRLLEYRFLEDNGLTKLEGQPIESTCIEFPLTFKYRSSRMGNFASYMLLGGQYNWDLSAQAKTDNNNGSSNTVVLKTTPHNYGCNVGAGMDFFMDFYKFSLEFKYFIGINNSFIQDNTKYSTPIDQLKSRMFIVSISFEG
jgi:hypothetical protein